MTNLTDDEIRAGIRRTQSEIADLRKGFVRPFRKDPRDVKNNAVIGAKIAKKKSRIKDLKHLLELRNA